MWKYIEGYKWPYRIDEDATVQKWFNGRWQTLTPYLNSTRARVKMRTSDDRQVGIPVVWLMADAFMGGRRAGYDIIHKNGAKLDCRLCNLKFSPRKATVQLSAGNKRKAVVKITPDGNPIEIYKSCTEAAQRNYISKSAVSARCRGEIKNPFHLTGYSFRFENRRRNRGESKRGEAQSE